MSSSYSASDLGTEERPDSASNSYYTSSSSSTSDSDPSGRSYHTESSDSNETREEAHTIRLQNLITQMGITEKQAEEIIAQEENREQFSMFFNQLLERSLRPKMIDVIPEDQAKNIQQFLMDLSNTLKSIEQALIDPESNLQEDILSEFFDKRYNGQTVEDMMRHIITTGRVAEGCYKNFAILLALVYRIERSIEEYTKQHPQSRIHPGEHIVCLLHTFAHSIQQNEIQQEHKQELLDKLQFTLNAHGKTTSQRYSLIQPVALYMPPAELYDILYIIQNNSESFRTQETKSIFLSLPNDRYRGQDVFGTMGVIPLDMPDIIGYNLVAGNLATNLAIQGQPGTLYKLLECYISNFRRCQFTERARSQFIQNIRRCLEYIHNTVYLADDSFLDGIVNIKALALLGGIDGEDFPDIVPILQLVDRVNSELPTASRINICKFITNIFVCHHPIGDETHLNVLHLYLHRLHKAIKTQNTANVQQVSHAIRALIHFIPTEQLQSQLTNSLAMLDGIYTIYDDFDTNQFIPIKYLHNASIIEQLVELSPQLAFDIIADIRTRQDTATGAEKTAIDEQIAHIIDKIAPEQWQSMLNKAALGYTKGSMADRELVRGIIAFIPTQILKNVCSLEGGASAITILAIRANIPESDREKQQVVDTAIGQITTDAWCRTFRETASLTALAGDSNLMRLLNLLTFIPSRKLTACIQELSVNLRNTYIALLQRVTNAIVIQDQIPYNKFLDCIGQFCKEDAERLFCILNTPNKEGQTPLRRIVNSTVAGWNSAAPETRRQLLGRMSDFVSRIPQEYRKLLFMPNVANNYYILNDLSTQNPIIAAHYLHIITKEIKPQFLSDSNLLAILATKPQVNGSSILAIATNIGGGDKPLNNDRVALLTQVLTILHRVVNNIHSGAGEKMRSVLAAIHRAVSRATGMYSKYYEQSKERVTDRERTVMEKRNTMFGLVSKAIEAKIRTLQNFQQGTAKAAITTKSGFTAAPAERPVAGTALGRLASQTSGAEEAVVPASSQAAKMRRTSASAANATPTTSGPARASAQNARMSRIAAARKRYFSRVREASVIDAEQILNNIVQKQQEQESIETANIQPPEPIFVCPPSKGNVRTEAVKAPLNAAGITLDVPLVLAKAPLSRLRSLAPEIPARPAPNAAAQAEPRREELVADAADAAVPPSPTIQAPARRRRAENPSAAVQQPASPATGTARTLPQDQNTESAGVVAQTQPAAPAATAPKVQRTKPLSRAPLQIGKKGSDPLGKKTSVRQRNVVAAMATVAQAPQPASKQGKPLQLLKPRRLPQIPEQLQGEEMQDAAFRALPARQEPQTHSVPRPATATTIMKPVTLDEIPDIERTQTSSFWTHIKAAANAIAEIAEAASHHSETHIGQ